MKKYIHNHEVVSFFLFTFALSWTIWFLAGVFLPATHDWGRVTLIAAYSPSLIGLVMVSLRKPSRELKSIQSFWIFFPLLFILAAAVMWLDSRWWGYPLTLVEIVLDLVLATFASFTLTYLLTSARYLSTKQYPVCFGKANIFWLILAVIIWPGLVWGANTLASMFGIQVPGSPVIPNVGIFPLVIEGFIWFFLFGGPLNEEIGWRGYALPRLQMRFNPLVAGLIIGFMWGFWHLPGHIIGQYPGGLFGSLIRLEEIPSGIIFAWLFNRTKGDLLPVLFLHAARNTTSLFIGRAYVPVLILWLLLSILLVLKDKMWRPIQDTMSYPRGELEGIKTN